jgi:hypothetical protein
MDNLPDPIIGPAAPLHAPPKSNGRETMQRFPFGAFSSGNPSMPRLIPALGLVAMALPGTAGAAETIRFWNLTSATVSEFALAPAGTTQFGPNQCLNDKDKEVDHDERLRLSAIEPGSYDARIGFRNKRVCYARGIVIKAGEVFSIEDADLKDCTK